MNPSRDPVTSVVDRYEPLLGTVVEIRIELDGEDRHDEATALSDSMAGEILRLQAILSSVDPDSEFSRWCRGEVDAPSPELCEVLCLVDHWRCRSAGRLEPAAGVLSRAWERAAQSGTPPTDGELATLVADVAEPRWTVRSGAPVRLRDATDCTLNALAKGWIADRAAGLALETTGLRRVAVNAGGDIAVRGPSHLPVAIEDPSTPWDNAPPLTVVTVRNAGLATSGGARKWFDVDGTRWSHVIDPRSGRPAGRTASVSVVAHTTADADALATVLGVIDPEAALDEASNAGIACCIVGADGRILRTEGWHELERLSSARSSPERK